MLDALAHVQPVDSATGRPGEPVLSGQQPAQCQHRTTEGQWRLQETAHSANSAASPTVVQYRRVTAIRSPKVASRSYVVRSGDAMPGVALTRVSISINGG